MGLVCRFSVGPSAGPHSAIWRAWTHNDEAYVAVRVISRFMKLSLHTPDWCGFAITSEHLEKMKNGDMEIPDDRTMVEWRRAPTPPEIGASRPAMIIIPTVALTAAGDEVKGVYWLPATGAGEATFVNIMFTRQPLEQIEAKIVEHGARTLIHHQELSNGESFVLASEVGAFDVASFAERNKELSGKATFLTGTTDYAGADLRGIFFGGVEDGGMLQLLELPGKGPEVATDV